VFNNPEQQVTLWFILDSVITKNIVEDFFKEPVKHITHKMQIRLAHAVSDKKLHSHDIRPPVTTDAYKREVSAYGFNFGGDENDLFEVEILPDKSHGAHGSRAKKRLRALDAVPQE
jgi:dolichyl-phosphate-mannose--protein O-mannosyl transferase